MLRGFHRRIHRASPLRVKSQAFLCSSSRSLPCLVGQGPIVPQASLTWARYEHRRLFNALGCPSSYRTKSRGLSASDVSAVKAQQSSAETLSIEDIYQKKTPVEHILLRPGMYIGSVESTKEAMWLVDSEDPSVMMKQIVEYVPAMYKIFDEILVNALDNKVRDKSMNRLNVTVDQGSKANGWKPWISIYNNGRGIPIQFHTEHEVYVPELVLGHLLTGSNFDDTASRLTGGRHGYGAKLTNIFSSHFIVETGDSKSGLVYRQEWKNNMRDRFDPEIVQSSTVEEKEFQEDFTKISFSPDLERFEMKKMKEGMMRVLQKRVYDVAGCLTGVDVLLNGKSIPVSGFESYVNSYRKAILNLPEDVSLPSPVLSRVNKRWEVAVLPSDQGFQQISFVNGMATLRGGTHVNYITDQLTRRIADFVNKKHSELKVTPAQVRPHMSVFINCMIENPTFDSQMKEFMSSKQDTYGSICVLSERFSKQVIASSGIIERVVDWAESKQRATLVNKSSTKRKNTVNVPKLEDANAAGTAGSSKCTLILTEGDSAKALAVAGLATLGRDYYGVFPLKGKLLNVRDANLKQLADNVELSNLCTILGLNFNETYADSMEGLRYGKVMLMTDQDHDGSHIKGLVINLFHHFWPKLLEHGYLSQFITPIIKATKRSQQESFFSIPEYHQWRDQMKREEQKKWHVKYYKGLGTNSAAEGREYFSNLPKHWIDFQWGEKPMLGGSSSDPAPSTSTLVGHDATDVIDLAFRKGLSEKRKQWLREQHSSETFLDVSQGVVTFEDFVNKELIHFSHADLMRSIPSVVDGLKPSQRKVLFACFKRRLNKEIKVAQLAGYCSEHTGYHHGEMSLHSTITNMAQDFVDSNNIPLLYPSGQFGTRLCGGKDAASARYIFTKLGEYTRLIFPLVDDALLRYKDDDGFPVEPEYYVPIIPMVLVNGAEGIGTGWSTSIPLYHPIQIIDKMLRMIEEDGKEKNASSSSLKNKLIPWVRGFTGDVVAVDENQSLFRTLGRVEFAANGTSVDITELPVGCWVEDFKAQLLKMISKNEIKKFTEHHTDERVHFSVYFTKQAMSRFSDVDSLRKFFKLEGKINTTNMHAFDASGKIQKYDTNRICEEFYTVRLAFYAKRKAYLVQKTSKECLKLSNRIRFVNEVANGTIDLTSKKITKAEIVDRLRSDGYASSSSFLLDTPSISSLSLDEEATPSELATAEHDEGLGDDFNYLLNTSLMNFTKEHVDALESDHHQKKHDLANLERSSPQDLWRHELLTLREALMKHESFHLNAESTCTRE